MLQERDIITGDVFKNLAHDYLDWDKTYIDLGKKPAVIFLKTDFIDAFKNKVMPNITYPFELITHNSDYSVPKSRNAQDLLENNNLKKWFGMNVDMSHPKLQCIPIGIANKKWPHGNTAQLLSVANKQIAQDKLVYSNFTLETNLTKRSDALHTINSMPFVTTDNSKYPFEKYLEILKSFKYVICPPGNSVDCHRIWEALYLGVIPIIEKHVAMEYFYDLPVMVVDKFDEITEEKLVSEYASIRLKSTDKMLLSHYAKLICQNV